MPTRAGVAFSVIRKTRLGIQKVINPETASRIQALPRTVVAGSAVGVARRLQALATMGYGVLWVSEQLGITEARARFLRRQRSVTGRIDLPTCRAVARLYEDLLLVQGRSQVCSTKAINRGWHPPEAWDDGTIDDPAAPPYGHLNDPEVAGYVDEIKVERARLPQGHSERVPFMDLTRAEQLVLYREHLARDSGNSDRAFVSRYRPVPVKILRALHQLQIQEVAGA
jgi:hypothetical protein